MINTAMAYNSNFYTQNNASSAKKPPDTSVKTSFQEKITDAASRAEKKEFTSAVEDYKRRHPEYAGVVDGQVKAGKEVLRKNGAEQVDRDSMTMDEYKQFFTGLMNSIPYDVSQVRDTNVWSITEKGWEQMKNDPDYEAWVLGYTSRDRAFHNPWASVTGYEPNFHTEHFGESIDEHLGQSFPVSSKSKKANDETDEETWWEKRCRRMKEIAKEQEELAREESSEKMRVQHEVWLQESIRQTAMHRQFLYRDLYGNQAGTEDELSVSGAALMSEVIIPRSIFGLLAGRSIV